ncbi:MAG: ATP-binding protein [Kofleriaceae bacterium]|nr:ATP-binding protein [Kofleriaceae bacterium]
MAPAKLTPAVVAREREQALLEEILSSDQPELVAVWGRRRIGKTFLIRNGRSVQGPYFELVGTKDGDVRNQLGNFSRSLSETFHDGITLMHPTSWSAAFAELRQAITKRPPSAQPITLFFDEAPWLDSRRAGFLTALEHFWNSWASTQSHVKVIVCGSSASWILNKVVNGKGGWHRRVTRRIHLRPFTLAESGIYLRSRGVSFAPRDLIEIYMVFGGTAAYLKEVKRGEASAIAISRLCLQKDAVFSNEYHELFHSLFLSAAHHMKMVEALATTKAGRTKTELRSATKLSGRQFTEILANLEQSDFVDSYLPFGKSAAKDTRYRLTDFFVLFHLRWMKRARRTTGWTSLQSTPSYRAWAGHSFETLVWNHIGGLLSEIGLQNAPVNVSTFDYRASDANDESAQIDLLIDVEKGSLYIIEIKHYLKTYEVTKTERSHLLRRKRVLQQETKHQRTVFIQLISSSGVKANVHSKEVVDFIYPLKCLLSS